jgi:hypothetical protein
MAALAVAADVATSLGRSLTAEETTRATPLLLLASAAVESETGYRFAPGTYVVERRVRRGQVRLPAKVATVTGVGAVDLCDGTETAVSADDYTLRGSTLYGLSDCWVEVTFTVTAAVPPVIVALVAGIVASSIVSAPNANVDSVTAGPFTTSYVDSSGRVFLSRSDKAILKPYKQPKPALLLLG